MIEDRKRASEDIPAHLETDVLIVGAGPIGIELAVALRTAGIRYAHVEAGQIGRTMTWFPRFMYFFSSTDRLAIAGVPIPRVEGSRCTVEEFLAYLRAVVQQYDLAIRTHERVNAIEREGHHFRITTDRRGASRTILARRVVLATGDMDMPHMVGVPGEDLPHVSHYFVEPHQYFRKRLLIVGGHNSGVEAAIRCARAGADVTLCHLDAEFDRATIKPWIVPELDSLVREGLISVHHQTCPREITNDSVRLERLDTGVAFDLPADFILLLTGYRADMSLFRAAGVELTGEEERPVFDERTMETTVPGIYVAGTATAGTQKTYTTFVENCHIHTDRILASLTGDAGADLDNVEFESPES